MGSQVLSSTLESISEGTSRIPTIILMILGVVVLIIVITFLYKSKHLESFDSMPAPFVTNNSVYSSLPQQNEQDAGWDYLAPYGSTCTAGEDGTCPRNRKFNVLLNPHNQRVEYWE